MDLTVGIEKAQSTHDRLTAVSEVVLHWIGTAAAAVTAYMVYTESDSLSLAAMGIGLFAVLLLIRSLGVAVE